MESIIDTQLITRNIDTETYLITNFCDPQELTTLILVCNTMYKFLVDNPLYHESKTFVKNFYKTRKNQYGVDVKIYSKHIFQACCQLNCVSWVKLFYQRRSLLELTIFRGFLNCCKHNCADTARFFWEKEKVSIQKCIDDKNGPIGGYIFYSMKYDTIFKTNLSDLTQYSGVGKLYLVSLCEGAHTFDIDMVKFLFEIFGNDDLVRNNLFYLFKTSFQKVSKNGFRHFYADFYWKMSGHQTDLFEETFYLLTRYDRPEHSGCSNYHLKIFETFKQDSLHNIIYKSRFGSEFINHLWNLT